MIKSLRVKNFQSHRDTLIKFSPGVNAIIGEPQSGKTALLRALALVVNNRPSGFRYHSHFATEAETVIEVETVEGLVEFRKGDGGASYKATVDGQTTDFPKAGVNVPDTVVSLLNLAQLNTQSQLDGPFLVGQPPAEIAREINRVTKIDLVDRWTSELNRRKHTTNSLALMAKRKAEESMAKASALEPVEQAGAILAEAESAQSKADAKKVSWNTIRLAIIALGDIAINEAKIERALLAIPFVDKAEKNARETLEKKQALALCQEMMECEEAEGKLARLVGMAGEALSEYDSYKARADKTREKLALVTTLLEVEKQVITLGALLEELRNEYADRLIAEPICPTCFTPISGDLEFTRQIIKEHL